MFWRDLNSTLTKQSEAPIGEIEFKRKYAQRRFIDRAVWDRLQKLSPIYNGDTIRTADLSQAIITFEGSNDRILISDNSIIQIIMAEDGSARIDLAGGNIEVDKQDSSGSLTLVSGNNEIVLAKGSRINVQSDAEKADLSLTVMQGSASLSSEQGSITMESGSALKVSSDGRTEPFVTIVDIQAYPTSYAAEASSNHIPVQFTWNASDLAETEYVRLEIAKNRRFSAIQQSFDASSENHATLAMDSAGTYYWRMYPAGTANDAAQRENASIGTFELVYSQPPQLVTPSEGFTYAYRTKQPAVRMYWSAENQDAWYQVEIANNPQMNNPEVMLVQESSLTNNTLDAGDWYWRVTPIYPNGFLVNHAPSEIGHFKIVQGGALQAPELLIPSPEAVINIAEDQSASYFSWKRGPEAVSYTIQVSDSANLENPIISREVTDNFYAYATDQSTIQTGRYYWAVYQTDNEGNSSPLSESRSFSAMKGQVEYITTFPPDNYAIADSRIQDLAFTWRSNLPFQNRFQISTDREFANLLIDDVTNASQYQVSTLPEGNYFWRIVSENGVNTLPLSTLPKNISIVGPLEAPTIISPAAGESLVFSPGENVDFTWEAVEDADHYRFALYRGDQQLFENLELEASSQSYDMDSLQPGEYRWTIQAFTSEDSAAVQRDGLIASSSLSIMSAVIPASVSVVPVPLLPAAAAVLPANDYVIEIDELAAVRGVNFEWQLVEGANQYVFSLYAKNSSGSLTPIIENQSLSGTSYLFEDMSVLDTGNFVWRLEAQNRQSDGTVDQRGNNAEFNFSIALPEIGIIKTNSPGTMYGN
ncbi:MAG: hypothetical protein LBV20_03050, partial [Treponema sp.]|jgi:hypothetical protein|nr:hypothetical protein [Treponema sp.]